MCIRDSYTNVQQAAYEIINRKKATFYGIGLSLNRLVHAVLDDENAILTVSAYQEGEYQQKGLYIGCLLYTSSEKHSAVPGRSSKSRYLRKLLRT